MFYNLNCHIYAEAEIHSQSVPGVPTTVFFPGLSILLTWSQIGHEPEQLLPHCKVQCSLNAVAVFKSSGRYNHTQTKSDI